MSRKPSAEQLLTISTITPQWLEDVSAFYSSNPEAQQLLSRLSMSETPDPHFSLLDGIIRFDGRIWLGTNTSLQHQVFSALHSSAIGGHSGAPATYHTIKSLFYWPKMKQDITHWVQAYQVCQQAKPDRAKSPGLLQPLPVPDSAWSVI